MPQFHSLRVKRVVRETPEAISVALEVPAELIETFRYRPGQHLTFRCTVDGEELRRSYSICSTPLDRELCVAIKRVNEGRFSNLANDTFAAGQIVEVMPPAGRFNVPEREGDGRHLLAFAAGVGITPILSMIGHVLTGEAESHVTLVYGNRRVSSILFLEQLQELKDRYLDRFRVIHVLSGEGEEENPRFRGRIDADKVRALSDIIDFAGVAHVFLCGPGSMIETVRKTLIELGVAADRIHRESFTLKGAAARSPSGTAAKQVSQQGASVTAIVDGVRQRFQTQPGESIIEAAIRCGIRLPWSCRGGMCCTCRARVVEGEAAMRVNYSLEPWEIERNFTLTCQAVPASAELVLDYDAV